MESKFARNGKCETNKGCLSISFMDIVLIRGILLATLAFLIVLSSPHSAHAAVTILDTWANKINTTSASPQTFTYTASSGANRLLVVAITAKYSQTGTRTYSAVYGGKPLTVIAQYNTGRDNTWVGYLKESDIASQSGNILQVAYSGSPSNIKVFAATYRNVDQSAPITNANRNGTNTATSSISFGKKITIAGGDQLLYVAHSGSATATHTPPSGYTELLEHTGNGLSVSVGHRNSTLAGNENQTVRFSASSEASLVAASLNEAAAASCTASAPTVSITPASQTITTNGGAVSYSVTVKNNDTGSGCANTSFSLASTDSDTTGANFMVPSVLNATSVTLAPGAGTSATLTVQARSGATTGTNGTSITASATGHANGTSNTVTTTIGISGSTGPEPSGWYAGDMHVHRSCGGAPEALTSLFPKMSTHNLSFLSLLADMGNGEVLDPVTDLPLVNGQDASISTAGRILHWDAEWHWDPIYTQYPHLALGGHIVPLGLTEAHQIWHEYTYPIFNWAHQQNAIAGFAHMQYLDDNIPQSLTCCTPIEYPVEVALGAADFISEDVVTADTTVSGMNPDSFINAYYRLLNSGFRPGFAAGTDYPCGNSQPGSLLTYAQVAGGQMSYGAWIQGIATGRTVVSRNGHNEFLDLKVNGSATPGDEIKLASSGSVQVTVQWTATQNLSGTIELVQNGVVIASRQASVSSGAPASLSATADFSHSGWLAARRMGNNGHVAHTAAVFVTVNNAPVRASASDAQFYVQWMDNLLTKTSPGGPWNSYFPTSLSPAQARYQSAKAIFQQIATEAALILNISSTSLPDGVLNTAYSAMLSASGGASPYTWSITGGSLPAGLSLNSSTGVISGAPTATGAFNFTIQAADAGTPQQTTTRSLGITVAAAPSYSIWSSSIVPANVDAGADTPVELGVKFTSDVNGYITGIRFYKASANTGAHAANLWSNSGARLATATFANESTSGWQQVNFTTPVAITANTVYVASYFCPGGHYSEDKNYFSAAGVDNAPLHALANGVSGVNGVYAYGAAGTFPTNGWNSANYWVDVVLSATLPALDTITVTPANQTIATGGSQQYTALGTYSDGSARDLTSQATWASSSTAIATMSSTGLATGIASGSTTISASMSGKTGSATLTVQAAKLSITTTSLPNGALAVPYTTTLAASGGATPYTWAVTSGSLPDGLTLNVSTGAISGTPTAAGTFSFTIQVTDSGGTIQTASQAVSIVVAIQDKPILIISSSSNPFTGYYAEILRNEGFNSFTTNDITSLSSSLLATYDIAILGEMAITSSQASLLSNWVTTGGKLIAMRPDKQLASLLGLTDKAATLTNGYLLVNTASVPGTGIVNQTIQYHGPADRYTLNGATSVATLYSDANATAGDPAVALTSVGSNGGQAAAFTYDLARSVVYTRQGNPAWAGQKRDGNDLIRSNDLFYGPASFDPQPNWIDFNKVAIPQADEQQRLLANLIITMNMGKKPLPRFWYLPRSLAAAIVMTGDDHGALYGGGATAARFDQFLSDSPPGCNVDNWECVRGSAYILPPVLASNPLTNSQAASYVADGFEVSVHVDSDPDCSNWTYDALNSFYTTDLNSFASHYRSVPAPATHRMHCVTWNDFDSQPKTELSHGIRLDTTYYYWPDTWINNHPGFFTGSGMPMRFTDINGNLMDIYQAPSQMTDESGQTYPYTVNTLLDNALGTTGYYGAFVVNAHNDSASSGVSDAVVQSAQSRGIPVITARQLLTWLDGRNGSTFNAISWNGTTLGFSVTAGQGANGLVAMVPIPGGQSVSGVTLNGNALNFTTTTIKGIPYARFPASSGTYQVSYTSDTSLPTITGVTPANGATGVSVSTTITATFSKAMDPATISSDTIQLRGPSGAMVSTTVAYDTATMKATLTPAVSLANSTTYTATVKGGSSGVKDQIGNPLASDYTWSFTTAAASSSYTIWPATTTPGTVDAGADNPVELGVKFRSDIAGYITGIRFYKASANTGTHVANLWSASGTLLATATFTNETASGWQQVNFPTPAPIAANTFYVASYHCANGHYSDNQNYFASSGVDNAPLHAPADGVSGANGVFAYGSSSIFPNNGWRSSNYWVDVVFRQ